MSSSTHRRRTRTWCRVLAVASPLAVLLAVSPAQAQVAPYEDPPFDCEFLDYGEGEAPPFEDQPDNDPLCVRYAKEDITVTGGAVDFLLAEPERVAAAGDVCRYWQRDSWSVQVAAGSPAIISWEGSYWFDRGAGRGAVQMRDLEIGGQPASPAEVADLPEVVDEELAAEFRAYGDETGGGGMAFDLGGGDPTCAVEEPHDDEAAQPDDEPDGEAGNRGGPPAETGPPAEAGPPATVAGQGGTLPVTGGGLALVGLALLGGAGLVRGTADVA
jgi:hypothetical protein